MSEEVFYYFQIASTFSVVLPIIAGITRFQSSDQPTKLLVFFLIIGFVVDLFGWYFAVTQNEIANRYFRHGYDLLEMSFFAWLITRLSDNQFLRKSFRWVVPIIVVAWLWRFIDNDAMSIFKSSMQVLIAFAASYCILRLVEREAHISKVPAFWILLAIFFYCFSTYFIMGLLATRLSKAWYIHNFINIATNIIYFVGFLISRRSPVRPAPTSF